MKKLLIIGLVLFLILLVSGCKKAELQDVNICGDDVCGLTEDCNTCVEDCACETGKYCDPSGICREYVCGDEICSDEEKAAKSCCEDCGCEAGEICNKVTQKCQAKPTVSEDVVKTAVDNYLKENNIIGKIIDITDVYHKEQTVKQVRVDCKTEEMDYPCEVILFIDNEGNIVEEMKTM